MPSQDGLGLYPQSCPRSSRQAITKGGQHHPIGWRVIVGLALRRRQPENASMLAGRVALFILVIAVVATGNAGSSLLAVHIPAAVATFGLVVRQVTIATQAREADR